MAEVTPPHTHTQVPRGRGEVQEAGLGLGGAAHSPGLTHNEAKFLVIPSVHGLAFLHAATAIVGFRLRIESDSSKFKYDVPLSLKRVRGEKKKKGGGGELL